MKPPAAADTAGGRPAATGLGRAVLAALPSRRRRGRHESQTNWLYDVILGGQDGLVNILGIILGVIAGGGSTTVLVATGFAAAMTESISMGAVGYTSALSQRDYYRALRAREEGHVADEPELEKQEVREIYQRMGFTGQLLDDVVDTITANRQAWIGTIMDQELHVQPVETPTILRSAVVITIATLIGHLIPLLPFLWLPRSGAVVTAILLSAVVLFGVGVYSAVSLVGDWRKSGARMAAIGLGAAAVGFLVGRLFSSAGG